MFGNLLRRLWNRRKDRRRLALNLHVCATDAEGKPFEGVSEDVSDNGIRLRSGEHHPAQLLGHQEYIEMEIDLKEEAPSLKVQAELIWAYSATGGGWVSGWHLARFRGNSRRRLRCFLDRCEADMDMEESA